MNIVNWVYNLINFFVGLEGILGIIIKVILRFYGILELVSLLVD